VGAVIVLKFFRTQWVSNLLKQITLKPIKSGKYISDSSPHISPEASRKQGKTDVIT
jgi:hypothetical protein